MSKRVRFYLIIMFFSCIQLNAQDQLSALIPMPNFVNKPKKSSFFKVGESTTISYNSDALRFAVSTLQQSFKERFNLNIPVKVSNANRNIIKLLIDSSLEGDEHYLVVINDKEIIIKGKTPGAVLYGVVTLDQLLLGDIINTQKKQIASIFIDDTPRFGWRSIMLDPARNFLPVKDVKFFIDQMMKYKYNVLQLHLTDDEGWRMEIKSHPALTKLGAVRNSKKGMDGPENGFYTQVELRDLVKYAAERNIQIVPEIDIPGHTASVLAAYPELGCSSAPIVLGKSNNVMLCAANNKVYDLYRDIIKEIADVFPSKYIHLGGDESAIEKNWAVCTHDKKLMNELEYQQPAQLMNYFFNQIFSFVKQNKKQAILWLELDNIRMPAKEYLFQYPKDVILITWRNGLTPLCLDLTYKNGNSIIMAPGEYAYFDYPQRKGDFPEFNNWGMPVTTLKTVMDFDPGYGRSKNEQAHILGINATLWGEAITDINRATYMAFPRALAFAEAGWTQMENRNSTALMKRIYPHILELTKNKVWVSTSFAHE